MANQNSPGTGYTVDRLMREYLNRHKKAGELPKNQHVFSIDDVQHFMHLYGLELGDRVIKSKGQEKQKRNVMYECNTKLLKESVSEYKTRKKTP